MGANYLLWLPEAFRAAGLDVIEYEGWQERARSSGGYADPQGPLCVMWHHTASNTAPANDVAYMADNADTAPIANVMPDRQGVVWLMAAGATNTNGSGKECTFSRGTVPVDGMNSHAFGMEIANAGTGEPYSQPQIDAAFLISQVVNERCGNQPTDVMVHSIYAAGRKVDPAKASAVQGPWQPHGFNGATDSWVLDDLIAECARRAGTQPQPPEPQPPTVGDTDMIVLILDDTREPYARYRCSANTKTWVNEGEASAQINLRLDECADGSPSPVDGMTYRHLRHGGNDVIASYGPIVGPVPDGHDAYGRH